jgi:hypothetical protein
MKNPACLQKDPLERACCGMSDSAEYATGATDEHAAGAINTSTSTSTVATTSSTSAAATTTSTSAAATTTSTTAPSPLPPRRQRAEEGARLAQAAKKTPSVRRAQRQAEWERKNRDTVSGDDDDDDDHAGHDTPGLALPHTPRLTVGNDAGGGGGGGGGGGSGGSGGGRGGNVS